MSKFELKLPKMGESVAEATLTAWLKEIGDKIEFDEPVVEIATDKVDSEVPSEKKGILIEKCFKVDDVILVGQTIAIIETDEVDVEKETTIENPASEEKPEEIITEINSEKELAEEMTDSLEKSAKVILESEGAISSNKGFLSPLVKNMIKKEGISSEELSLINGTGKDNRITKNDILSFLSNRSLIIDDSIKLKTKIIHSEKIDTSDFSDEVIEMTKMGKLISQHMTDSVKTSAHVQSFIEVDVTNIFNWRNRVKSGFESREGQKFTFTPIFISAIVKSLKEFPILNSSVVNGKIVIKRAINIGMATAVENGNLIVPVIKNADHLNLKGLAFAVNDLSKRARSNSLKPEEISDGTYTVTNVGNFGSIMGTPIINQPQVGIIAIGVIRKLPSVIETDKGDFVGIRKKLILSHTYDHRIINGSIGGNFVKRVAEYLEAWDMNQTI